MARLMLFGAGGQIGQAVRAQPLPPGLEILPLTHAACDIADHRAVQRQIQQHRPDIVLNAAAMTAVDRCETEQDEAVAANFEAPANLAAQCSALDIPLIHLSTDHVFDGTDGAVPYKVDDQMAPVNVYGNTKMMGEESIRHEMAWHVILRVSSVFSEFGTNLLTKALASIDSKDEIRSVTDQIASPTYAPDIASALLTIAAGILKGKADGFGTFHYCGSPPANRLEFMQAIMEAYAPYTDKRPALLPAVSADFPGFAARPPYSALDCSKIAEVYGIAQKPWREGIATAIDKLKNRSAA